MFMTTKYTITTLSRKPRPKTMWTHAAEPVTLMWKLVTKSRSNKTRLLNSARLSTETSSRLSSKSGNSVITDSSLASQYSRNTSHMKQYLQEEDSPTRQESEVLTAPAALATDTPAAGLLNSKEHFDSQERSETKSETPSTSRPQKT